MTTNTANYDLENSFTVGEVAKQLNMPYNEVLNCINNGSLESYKPDGTYGRIMIHATSIEKFKDSKDKNTLDTSKLDPNTRWVDTKVAASLLGVSIGAMQRMLYNGDIRQDKTRKRNRIRLDDIMKFAKKNHYIIKNSVTGETTKVEVPNEEVAKVEENVQPTLEQATEETVSQPTLVEEPQPQKPEEEEKKTTWYTVKQIASLLELPVSRIYTAIKSGALQTEKRREDGMKTTSMANEEMISKFIDTLGDEKPKASHKPKETPQLDSPLPESPKEEFQEPKKEEPAKSSRAQLHLVNKIPTPVVVVPDKCTPVEEESYDDITDIIEPPPMPKFIKFTQEDIGHVNLELTRINKMIRRTELEILVLNMQKEILYLDHEIEQL